MHLFSYAALSSPGFPDQNCIAGAKSQYLTRRISVAVVVYLCICSHTSQISYFTHFLLLYDSRAFHLLLMHPPISIFNFSFLLLFELPAVGSCPCCVPDKTEGSMMEAQPVRSATRPRLHWHDWPERKSL